MIDAKKEKWVTLPELLTLAAGVALTFAFRHPAPLFCVAVFLVVFRVGEKEGS